MKGRVRKTIRERKEWVGKK